MEQENSNNETLNSNVSQRLDCNVSGRSSSNAHSLKMYMYILLSHKKELTATDRPENTNKGTMISGTHYSHAPEFGKNCGIGALDNETLDGSLGQVNKGHQCDICNKVLSTARNLKRHRLLHTAPKNRKRHTLRHTDSDRYRCNTCGRIFNYSSSLEVHEYEHIGGGGSYGCEFCSLAFPTVKQLEIHVKMRHKSKSRICSICGFLFPCRYYLKKHMLSHTKEKTYRCDLCNKKLKSLDTLKTHVLRHFGLFCKACGREFQNANVYKHHICLTKVKKKLICEICGKLCCPSALKDHLNTHKESPLKEKVRCDACGKTFANKVSLAMHTRLHSGDKRYTCKLCQKTFTQPYSLTVHMRVHTKAKPFTCNICGKKYSQSYPLTLHKRTKHS